MGQKATRDVEPERKPEKKPEGKLDLSAAQVAGSSLATVAAALLASKLGVYGTILGAGVVSVVATAGGPVIQHFFRRTGDQLRGTAARPKTGQVPAPHAAGAPPAAEFGAATVHGTRVRGWKRTAVASGAAFALAIGGLGTYEAMAGTSVSADGRTLLTGGAATAPDHKPDPPKEDGGGGVKPGPLQPGNDGKPEKGGKSGESPGPDTSPDTSADPSRSSGGRGPAPEPSRSAPVDPTPSPSPSKHTPTPTPTPTPGPDESTPAGGAGTGQGQRSAP
ncbi:hypothetical protein ABZX75_10040 [Streptomyces sp. NPDC003038]|uniref:hypothetical protein n=1 Tax=unclassified Streptomyces TaxID=2593676 RepID=UPI0033B990FF